MSALRRGTGWRGTINAALYAHEQAQRVAADILTAEHGDRHQPGERADMCRHCIYEEKQRVRLSQD
jgi:hypothetical protein